MFFKKKKKLLSVEAFLLLSVASVGPRVHILSLIVKEYFHCHLFQYCHQAQIMTLHAGFIEDLVCNKKQILQKILKMLTLFLMEKSTLTIDRI